MAQSFREIFFEMMTRERLRSNVVLLGVSSNDGGAIFQMV